MEYVVEFPYLKIEFARRLKGLRESKGYESREVAKMLNVKRQTYADWENETRTASPEDKSKQVALCEILGTSMDYLFRGLFEGQKEPTHKQAYLDIYSRYKTDPDFNLLLRYLMQADQRVTEALMNFIEVIDCQYQGFPIIGTTDPN